MYVSGVCCGLLAGTRARIVSLNTYMWLFYVTVDLTVRWLVLKSEYHKKKGESAHYFYDLVSEVI